MSNKNRKINSEYKPGRKEINAINHYWEVVQSRIRGVKNREQRRKSHARG